MTEPAPPRSIVFKVEAGDHPISDQSAAVVLSKEQRTLLKRGIEQVLAALHFVEVAVEVAPDGTVRVAARLS
jgi:hypothetical protein